MADKALGTKSASTERPAYQRGLLRAGKKGNKGGPGRPPKGYKSWLQAQLDSLEHRQAFERAIKNDQHDSFEFATRHAAEHAIGKPVTPVELTGKDGAPFVVKLVRE
jgi:hypothetical protein